MNDLVVSRLRAAGCVFAEDEAELLTAAAATPEELDAMVERRVAGLPLEHVVGWAEFCGLRIEVDPGVFVPRRRTEFLVRQAVEMAARPDPVVVDLCCGSGALGVAVVAALSSAAPAGGAGPAGGVELYAADVDPAAVRCARRNVEPVGGHVYEGDLGAPLPPGLRGRVDIMLANVPYVPTADLALLPAEAREHEARVALDGGADGLDLLRRVASAAPSLLAPDGHLFFETSERQAAAAAAAVAAVGLAPRVLTSEDYGATVVVASIRSCG